MNAQTAHGNYLFLLNFHGLGKPGRELPAGEEEYWIEPAFFADILNSVQGRGEVKITFDDSNQSDFTHALPLLKARNMTAQFFVVAWRISQKGSLSANQIRTLCAEGMAVGNHGMRHVNWMRLDPTELQEELVEARDIIQQVTEAPVMEAACPFGGYNRRVLGMLRKSGYRKVYTSDRGVARPDAWIQPKITIRRCDKIEGITQMVSLSAVKPDGLKRKVKLLLKRWR